MSKRSCAHTQRRQNCEMNDTQCRDCVTGTNEVPNLEVPVVYDSATLAKGCSKVYYHSVQ